MTEFWTSARSLPGRSGQSALRAEREGWDGITFTDSQNLSGDPYVAMATAAAATEKVRLSTGVTNPWTRHAAVTASGIACVNEDSGGRAELGIGRGDSALAHIGMAPVSPAVFEDYVTRVSAYLAGESVAIDDNSVSSAEASHRGGGRSIRQTLTVADVPLDSRLRWLKEMHVATKVPIFAVASGPKMVTIAARVADRVALALGADAERLRWGIDLARQSCPDIPISAYIHVVPHDDPDEATKIAAGGIASFARFSAMHGNTAAPAQSQDRTVMESVAKSYQISKHFQGAGSQAAVITTEFAQRFAVIGTPDECVRRLTELSDLGIDRFHVSIASRDTPEGVADHARRRFVEEVLPRLR